MSEFIDTFVNFLTLCPGSGAFDSLFCPEGRVFVHSGCPGGRVFAPFKSCPGGLSRGGMVMDEIDTCIISVDQGCLSINFFFCWTKQVSVTLRPSLLSGMVNIHPSH